MNLIAQNVDTLKNTKCLKITAQQVLSMVNAGKRSKGKIFRNFKSNREATLNA